MKLKDYLIENALHETRVLVDSFLIESVNDYFALTLAKLKNKKSNDLFSGGSDGIDLDHLAEIIVGLKILGNSEYRSVLTKDDIGIQPNAKELFILFNNVAKDGNDPSVVKKVFTAVTKLAPTALKKQRDELESLKNDDTPEREHEVRQLETFAHKVSQAFGKLKAASTHSKSFNDLKPIGNQA